MARIALTSSFLLLSCLPLLAQDRASTTNEPPRDLTFVAQEKKPDKGKLEDKKTQPPVLDVDLSAALSAPQEAPMGYSPQMLGELNGVSRLVLVDVPAFAFIPDVNRPIPIKGKRGVRVATFSRSGFKIGENEFVMPQDRASFTYNYYNNAQGPSQGSNAPLATNGQLDLGNGPTPVLLLLPPVSTPRFDVHRETLGFEKSFLDGNFSVGVRVPLFQQNGGGDLGDSDLGDMSFIFKYAPYVDRVSGSGVSVGLAVTVPTGPDFHTSEGDIHSTLIQPFVGYQLSGNRVMLYGFTSLAVPTDDRDVTLFFNDIGLGYRLLQRDGFITSVTPAIEVHVSTPLDHRNSSDVIQGIDQVVLTSGFHFGLGQSSLMTLGIATPVTGPRPYEVEAIVQFNFRF